MSNKFWAAGSDSDSESSASSESSSDDERQGPGGRTTGRFQMSDSSSGECWIFEEIGVFMGAGGVVCRVELMRSLPSFFRGSGPHLCCLVQSLVHASVLTLLTTFFVVLSLTFPAFK